MERKEHKDSFRMHIFPQEPTYPIHMVHLEQGRMQVVMRSTKGEILMTMEDV